MLSEKQILILNKNKVQVNKTECGNWYFTVNGEIPRQSYSFSEEGALKKAIGYIMGRKR